MFLSKISQATGRINFMHIPCSITEIILLQFGEDPATVPQLTPIQYQFLLYGTTPDEYNPQPDPDYYDDQFVVEDGATPTARQILDHIKSLYEDDTPTSDTGTHWQPTYTHEDDWDNDLPF